MRALLQPGARPAACSVRRLINFIECHPHPGTKFQDLKLKVFPHLRDSCKTPLLEETRIQDLKLGGLSSLIRLLQLQDLNLIF